MPAINIWPKPSYLQKYSNQPVEVEVSSHNSPGYGERNEMTLGEYLFLLSHPLPCRIYLAQFPLFERIPELARDVTTPLVQAILSEGDVYNTSTWIGKQSVTPLHHDPRALTNLFVQICGRKEIRMLPPSISTEKLRLGDGELRNTAGVDVWSMSIGEEMEGVVTAGDGLIIPRGWWHSVRSREDKLTMSVNWWFKLKSM